MTDEVRYISLAIALIVFFVLRRCTPKEKRETLHTRVKYLFIFSLALSIPYSFIETWAFWQRAFAPTICLVVGIIYFIVVKLGGESIRNKVEYYGPAK